MENQEHIPVEAENLIEDIAKQFDKKGKSNKRNHKANFKKEIQTLERLKTFYIVLSALLAEKSESSSKAFFGKNYSDVIANNFHISQTLFESGFHIQIHLLFRSQFEYLNNFIAFIGDEHFFKTYCSENIQTNLVLTPKPIHTKKAIKNIFQNLPIKNFHTFWKDYHDLHDNLYSKLSINAHGNIPHVSLQSYEGIKGDKEKINRTLFGVNYPIENTVNMLHEMLNYFQIGGKLIYHLLLNDKLLSDDIDLSKIAEYYSNKIERFN